MSDIVTDTNVCIGKNLPIQSYRYRNMSDTIACISKNLPIHTMVLSAVKRNLVVVKNRLKGQ
jgi:hypothetical protein